MERNDLLFRVYRASVLGRRDTKKFCCQIVIGKMWSWIDTEYCPRHDRLRRAKAMCQTKYSMIISKSSNSDERIGYCNKINNLC